jgi:hypothetical protein
MISWLRWPILAALGMAACGEGTGPEVTGTFEASVSGEFSDDLAGVAEFGIFTGEGDPLESYEFMFREEALVQELIAECMTRRRLSCRCVGERDRVVMLDGSRICGHSHDVRFVGPCDQSRPVPEIAIVVVR